MRERLSLLTAIGRETLATPDLVAHGLILRDLEAWLRLQFLGVAARSGIAAALPAAPHELDVADTELAAAFLELGAALGELRRRADGRFEVKGRRLKAVAKRSPDLHGLVEELVSYDSPIYTNLHRHLNGEPRGDYLDGLGGVIARASRLAEPVLAPVIRSHIAAAQPQTVLDVGCGTGVYLKHALDAAPNADVRGIDLSADAIANAVVPAERVEVKDLFDMDGQFDVVLLLQNIYYWPPEERPRVLAKLRELTTRSVVVASAVAEGQAFNRHFDLVLRVTEHNWRLPTKAELHDGLVEAGFENVRVIETMPGAGLIVAFGEAGRR